MSSQQVFSDRYELVNHIARGGMAQVYLAKDVLLDRPVALKVLFPELSVDRSFVERFRREAKAAANLTHPNIVSIYDWGQGERTYFIVMEYVDGQTLSRLLRNGPLDAGRAAGIGADVAAALEFAHRRGVIHRDVKPGNVLIDNSGQVKVADFGIARAVGTSDDLTQTGSVMGTATYFSPEQAQGHSVDARSDVYSLGVVLYEMVAGRPPFSGDSPVSIAYKHVKEAPEPPSTVNPAVPAGFEAIVMKTLAKDPENRYQSADELRADLLRFANGQQVAAAFEPTRVAAAVGGAAVALPPTAVVAGIDPTRVQTGPATVVQETASYGRGPVPPPPRGRGWLIALILLLLLALIAAGVFFLGKSKGWWDSTKTIVIPTDVVHKTQSAAKTELNGLGFTNVTARDEANSLTPGHVITTSPAPGTKAKASDPIVLLVSSGPAPVGVPDVVNEPLSTAETSLRDAGFTYTTTPQSSTTVNQDYVISTNPGATTLRPRGSSVQIVYSTGVKLPFLGGDSQIEAAQALGRLNITVSSTTSQPSSTVAAGSVINTEPPAGTSVAPNSSVTLIVSSGAATTTTAAPTTTTTQATTTTTVAPTTTTKPGPPSTPPTS